jgi:hypothetical protein
MADIGQVAERIEKVIERACDLADRYGKPSDVQPGPVAGHVTLRWTDNSCSMVAVEFDAGLPAAEAVERLRAGLREHKFGFSGSSGGRWTGWTAICEVCGKRVFGTDHLDALMRGADGALRYGCPGKKEGE